jgi:hypothetical protein
METPSEWAKRFNRQKPDEEAGSPKPEAETVDSPASVAEFPSEPFQCPACGQLLAPACRVCVACKHPINPAEIGRPQEVALPAAHAPSTEPGLEPVRYPWRIFFAVLGISLFLALLLEGFVGEQKAQLAMGGAQTLAGVWVFFDALRQRIPRPLRWGVGSMLLPVVIFPWYLARRRKLQSPVPFVEAEVGPVTRFLLFALLVFFLASLIFYLVQGPPPALTPTSPPKEHKSSGNSQVTINNLRPWKEGGRQRRPGEGSLPFAGASRAQAETSAPSDARQT